MIKISDFLIDEFRKISENIANLKNEAMKLFKDNISGESSKLLLQIILSDLFDIEKIRDNNKDLRFSIKSYEELFEEAKDFEEAKEIKDLKKNFDLVLKSNKKILLYISPIYALTKLNLFPTVKYYSNCDEKENFNNSDILCSDYYNSLLKKFSSDTKFFQDEIIEKLKSDEGIFAEHFIYELLTGNENNSNNYSMESDIISPILTEKFRKWLTAGIKYFESIKNNDKFLILSAFKKMKSKLSDSLPSSSLPLSENYTKQLLKITNDFIIKKSQIKDEYSALISENASYEDGRFNIAADKMHKFREDLKANIKNITRRYIFTNRLVTKQFKEFSLFNEKSSCLDDLKKHLEGDRSFNRPLSEIPKSHKERKIKELSQNLGITEFITFDEFIESIDPKNLPEFKEYIILWVDKYLQIPKFIYPDSDSNEGFKNTLKNSILDSYVKRFQTEPQEVLDGLYKFDKKLLVDFINAYYKKDNFKQYLSIFFITNQITKLDGINDDLQSFLDKDNIATIAQLANEIIRIENSVFENKGYNTHRILNILRSIPDENDNIFKLLSALIISPNINLQFIISCFSQYFSIMKYSPKDKKYLDLVLLPILTQAKLMKSQADDIKDIFTRTMNDEIFNRNLCLSFIKKINNSTIETSEIIGAIETSKISEFSEMFYNISFFITEENMRKLSFMIIDISKSIIGNDISLSNRKNKEKFPFFKINKYLSQKPYLNQSVVECLTIFEDEFFKLLLNDIIATSLTYNTTKRDIESLAKVISFELNSWRSINIGVLSEIINGKIKNKNINFFTDLINFMVGDQKNLNIPVILQDFDLLNKFFTKIFFVDIIEQLIKQSTLIGEITPEMVILYMNVKKNPNFSDKNMKKFVFENTYKKLNLKNYLLLEEFKKFLIDN